MEKADTKDDNESFIIVSKKDEWKNKRKGFFIEAKVNNWRAENGYYYLSIITILTNNSSDTIRYATYSCSWDINYETDNKTLPIYRPGCNKDIPKVITILPYSMDVERELEVRTKIDTAKLDGLKLRMGFNYIHIKSGEDIHDKTKLLFKHSNLTWSNTLILK